MAAVFKEENGIYEIDCTKAVWATDQINAVYHKSKVALSDVDFIIENENSIYMIEYKNAAVSNITYDNNFKPTEDKTFNKIVRKYYDSLHYLYLLGRKKPKVYIYIVEGPKVDSTMRKRLRERLKNALPFELQKQLSASEKLIDNCDVLSINEWNNERKYGEFPIKTIHKN